MTAVTDLAFRSPRFCPGPGYGRFEVRTVADRLVIDQADPRILVTRELMTTALRYGSHPDVEITQGRIVVDAANKRVVYRVGRYLPMLDCYEAELSD